MEVVKLVPRVAQSQAEIVSFLSDILAMAKRGDFKHIGFVGIGQDGTVSTTYRTSGVNGGILHLAGAASYLHHRLMDEWHQIPGYDPHVPDLEPPPEAV